MEFPKRALVRGQEGGDLASDPTGSEYAGDPSRFAVKDATGEIVLEGVVSEPRHWELSGDAVGIADFSEPREPDEYTLCVGATCSHSFEIGDGVYGALADASLKSYYYARVGVDIEEAFEGGWHYPGGHPDTAVFIHESAADDRRPANSTISSPGGWSTTTRSDT